MRKATLLLVAVLALVVGVTVSVARTNAPTANCVKVADDDKIIDQGFLTIGADNPAFPPWFGGDQKTKPWKISDPYSGKGYESAVAYEVARRMGVTKAQVKWTPVPFLKSFAPGKKPFDFYIAQISVKPERTKAVDFSISYYFVNQAVVGMKGKPITKVKTVAGLKPYTLGVAIGTTSYDYIVKFIKPSGKPKVYDSNNDAISALKNGQIDGLVVDFPSTGYITNVQVPNSTVVGRLPTRTNEHFGLVFQKGNPLVACANQALRAMTQDGTLKRLERTWLAGTAAILK